MPGSSMPDIVIAPDLSNLPRGASTRDTGTGEKLYGPDGNRRQNTNPEGNEPDKK